MASLEEVKKIFEILYKMSYIKLLLIIIGVITIVGIWKGPEYIAQWNKYEDRELFKELIHKTKIQYKELKIGEYEIKK